MSLFCSLRRLFFVLAIASLLQVACNQNSTGAEENIIATEERNDPSEFVDEEERNNGETNETAGNSEDNIATETPTPTESIINNEVITSTMEATDSEPAEASPQDEGDEEEEDPNARMLLMPGGTFPMGGVAEDLLNECRQFRTGCQESWFLASEPEHLVEISPFYIDPYEITNTEFLEFLGFLSTHDSACFGMDCFDPEFSRIDADEDGTYFSSEAARIFPVLGVTWFGAASYCQWRGARLPTEAEWEMAASWDPETETKTRYPWGDVFDGDVVSFCDAKCQTEHANDAFDDGWIIEAPVGIFEEGVSPIGAYDMGGNLWEWVSDWYSPTYYLESPTVNPRGPTQGEQRVVRGGSWFDTGNFTSTLIRFPINPAGGSITIGFRCARDAE